MCYSIYEKRSAAAKQGMDNKTSVTGETDKATMKADSSAPERKAYSGFRARLQRWIAQDDRKEEKESVS